MFKERQQTAIGRRGWESESGRVEHADGNRPATLEERESVRAPQPGERASLTGKKPAGMYDSNIQKFQTLEGATNRSCDKSFLKKKISQPSTALPYFDITTRRHAQNQSRSDCRNAEGDAGRERHRLRQAATRAARRYAVTPVGLSCCVKSSHQPTYMHTHTHTLEVFVTSIIDPPLRGSTRVA